MVLPGSEGFFDRRNGSVMLFGMANKAQNSSGSLLDSVKPSAAAAKSEAEGKPELDVEPLSWERVVDILQEKLLDWFDTGIALLPNLVIAIVILVLCYSLGSVLGKVSNRVFDKAFDSNAVAKLFATIIKIVVITIGFFIALDLVGLQKAVFSLLAGAGIIGLALGFAFQDLAENLLAGLLMGVRKPCEPGDLIRTNSQFGFVQELNLRNTVIRNFDGQIIYIPNKEVFKSVLENYSKSGERRIDLAVGVSYGEDLENVTKTLREAIENLDFLKPDQPVEIFALEFGESSINFSVRYWIEYPGGEVDFFAATDRGIKTVKQALDDADILIPFPIRTLDFNAKGGVSLRESLPESLGQSSEKSNEDDT